MDHLRRQGRQVAAELEDTAPDHAPSPEAVVAAAQDAARLRACIAKLAHAQRAAIHLAFFEELSLAQVARIEQTPESTIKSRIFHAKRLLMRCLTR